MEAGIVSQALLTEVGKRVREQGLVAWVDAEGSYTGWVDRLAQQALSPEAAFPFPVVRYRSSYLELMLALEPYGNDARPDRVLVHLPGLNKDTVRETPVFELYKAGKIFEKNLATLIREAARGEARPSDIEAFLGGPNVSLEAADSWLASLHAAPRDGLSLVLETLGLDEVVLGLFRRDARITRGLPDDSEKLFVFLQSGLGISEGWRKFVGCEPALSSDSAATLVSSWLMGVEFVADLGEPPHAPELRALTKLTGGPFVKVCRELAERTRTELPLVYESFALDLQERLGADRVGHVAGVLGSVDTFRFEEAATREAALAALTREDWASALGFAGERTSEKCFWVRREPRLQRTWEIIRRAAETGSALSGQSSALKGCASLEEAVDRYVNRLADIDRQHRLFEQRAHALLAHDLDDYDPLLEARSALRRAYRAWADEMNRAFSALCEAQGVLPPPNLRQRALFEQVVLPELEQAGRVAFFMVDALRFEMAQALGRELEKDKYVVSLQARLAELPTITAVGMNALAPVQDQGKLKLAFEGGKVVGLRLPTFTVKAPADRVRVMNDRVAGGLVDDIELEEFLDLPLAKLKRRLGTKAGLVVVRSRQLDDAGENNLHLGTFDQTLTLLKSAISLLQQSGVERFVISSDHGFLLQDGGAENMPFGASMRSADRRHALLSAPSGKPDVLEVPFSALLYETDSPQYLVFRQDTALWKVKNQIAPFVHGGNSLQERVIPVLLLERQGRRGKATTKYEVLAQPEPAQLGRQRLRLSVRLRKESSAALSFHAPKAIALALTVPGRPDVTLTLLDAGPPATLSNGRILIPPDRDDALVEFELEGETDEMLRVQVYHPDGVEDVTPKIVEGFFEVFRNRRLAKNPAGRTLSPPGGMPAVVAPVAGVTGAHEPIAVAAPGTADDWQSLVEDDGYRKVLVFIEQRRSINEEELSQVLGSARRVRAFSRDFDNLTPRVPFGIEIRIVSGLKTYVRKE